MIMDRTEKVRKLQELKKEIKRKELQIIEKQSELKILEEEYMQEETSELPILLFLIDETLPMPGMSSLYGKFTIKTFMSSFLLCLGSM